MSPTSKTSAAEEEAKPVLVPRLRFLEFRETEGWEPTSLGSVARLRNGYAFKSAEYVDAGPYRIITIANVQQGNLTIESTKQIAELPSDIQQHQVLSLGDILISMTGNVGRVCRVTAKSLLLNQRVGKLSPHEINAVFFYQLLQRDEFRNTMQLKAAGGAQGNLSGGDITEYAFSTPATHAEQQKIAECLSSVDELMAAQARKVDALKTHKKGLMQQLFPRDGETQPRLRFPEFQNAGEWEEGKLISLSNEPLSNGVFNDPQKVGTGYKLINVSDMYSETTIDENNLSLLELTPPEFEMNQVLTGDIFFTRSSLVKSGIAVSNIYLGSSSDVTYDGHLIRIRVNTSKVIPLFAHYLFKTALVRTQLIARGKTATMTTIGQADVASVSLFYPNPDEQQRIASCLSRLDDLITAETQKLETIKSHKKGLMQQLFPSLEHQS